ncbi:hypothetical protein GCM10028798_12180 [Humibacter antri]
MLSLSCPVLFSALDAVAGETPAAAATSTTRTEGFDGLGFDGTGLDGTGLDRTGLDGTGFDRTGFGGPGFDAMRTCLCDSDDAFTPTTELFRGAPR